MDSRHRTGLTPPLRVVAVLLLAAVAALAVMELTAAADHRLRVTLLDTAGGSATLLRAPDGEVALIDGGSQPDHLIAALGRVLPPTAHQIDLLLLTGDSIRLVAGAAGLPGHYTVATAVVTGAVSVAERDLLETLRSGGTETVAVSGRPFAWAAIGFAPIEVGGDTAGAAAVMAVAGETRILILGDLDPTAQEELAATAQVSLRADLVVAPSRGGIAVSLLTAAAPRLIAVPTAGRAADHTAWAGAEVGRTGTDGDLTYLADPQLRRG